MDLESIVTSGLGGVGWRGVWVDKPREKYIYGLSWGLALS